MFDTNVLEKLIENNSSKIFSFLEKLVNINSFTQNISGLKKVGDEIISFSKSFNLSFEKYFPLKDSERFHLIYNKKLQKDFYGIVGHFDTVHPPDGNFQKLIEKDGKLIGPGVNDMKGGITVALFSMFTLKELGLPTNFKVIFNSDEEIGSKTSRKFIRDEMKGAKAVFVFEAGRLPGNKIISERKGVMELIIEISGKNSHAGESPQKGINAIVELSDKILKLYKLNNFIEGMTLQPGIIEGGIARNVIPDYAKAVIDVRYKKRNQVNKINKKIYEILKDNLIQGSKIKYTLNPHRPPLELTEESKKFIDMYINIAKKLGFEITTTATGGVSDANIISDIAPVMDGLGPLGEYCHTENEYIIKKSLIDRIKIFTCFAANLIKNKGSSK